MPNISEKTAYDVKEASNQSLPKSPMSMYGSPAKMSCSPMKMGGSWMSKHCSK